MNLRLDAGALSPLSLYVAALAGRSLALRWHEESHGLTYCDGATIAVAAVRGDAAWLDLTLQALLVRQGSFSARSMRRLVGRPALARGYLAYELARGVTQARPIVPRGALEHTAISQLPPPTPNRAASLECARALRLATPPAAWGVLMPLKVLARRAPTTLADLEAGDGPAHESDRPVPRPRRDDESELDHSAILDALQSPAASMAGLGRLLGSLFKRERAEGAAAGSGTGDLQVSDHSWLAARRARQVEPPGRLAEPAAPPPSTLEACYPEWDEHGGCYRPNFVRVAQVEPDPDAPLEPTRARGDGRALRRVLARLALGYETRRHQLQGDDLDLDALVALRADLASGQAGDPRIYRAPARTKRDLSALVLLDITGSTGERTAGGLRVFDQQLDFALSLTRALSASGDRTSLYAFHSWGAKIVRVLCLLDFDERPASRLVDRARRLSPVGYSRLGAAVRHGSHLLRARARTSHRLLIVVSDALAYDHGYEGAYAHADTRRALAEARAENIACVCLSVGASTDEPALEQVFGGSCHLALAELRGHESALRRLFESALAEVTRRARDRSGRA